jgi:hypothetical protein
MLVIPATLEAHIGRIVVQSQPQANSSWTPSGKSTSQKTADAVAQGEGPEFKPQYCKTIYLYIDLCMYIYYVHITYINYLP